MNIKDNRKKWVEALRSGKYGQAKEVLSDGKGNYCCLGVLCNVYEHETGDVLDKDVDDGMYDVEEDTLDELPEVMEWVGLRDDSGQFLSQENVPSNSLTRLNDDYGWNFNEIADLIESEPKGLFKCS